MSEIEELAKERELKELAMISSEISNDDWQIRIRAINKLIAFKKSDEFFKECIPKLIEATKDESSLVRLAAIPALGDLGPKARTSTSRLIEVLQCTEIEEVKAAVHSLGKIGDDSDLVITKLLDLYDADYLNNSSEELSKSLSWALGILGPAAIPHFRNRIKNGSISLQIGILQAIGIMGPPAISLLEECINCLGSENINVRKEAAKAVGNLRASNEVEKAVPYLISALKDNDPDVRWLMSEALRKIGSPKALEAWASYEPINSISALSKQLSNPDKAVRENAAENLFPLLHKGATFEAADFKSALRQTSHVKMLVLLIDALSNLEEDSLVFLNELEDLLTHEAKEVRATVCGLFSKLPELPEVLVPKLIILLKDSDKDVRLKAGLSLENSKDKLAAKALEKFEWC